MTVCSATPSSSAGAVAEDFGGRRGMGGAGALRGEVTEGGLGRGLGGGGGLVRDIAGDVVLCRSPAGVTGGVPALLVSADRLPPALAATGVVNSGCEGDARSCLALSGEVCRS